MKTIVIICLVLFACFAAYWFAFVKSQKVSNKYFIKICRPTDSSSIIRASLTESAQYIDHFQKSREGDTLHLEIYTTSIYNIFNSSKMAFIEIGDLSGMDWLTFAGERYGIKSLVICRQTN